MMTMTATTTTTMMKMMKMMMMMMMMVEDEGDSLTSTFSLSRCDTDRTAAAAAVCIPNVKAPSPTAVSSPTAHSVTSKQQRHKTAQTQNNRKCNYSQKALLWSSLPICQIEQKWKA